MHNFLKSVAAQQMQTDVLKKESSSNGLMLKGKDKEYHPASSMAFRRFMKSFAWLVCRVVGLFTPREKPLQQAACDFR